MPAFPLVSSRQVRPELNSLVTSRASTGRGSRQRAAKAKQIEDDHGPTGKSAQPHRVRANERRVDSGFRVNSAGNRSSRAKASECSEQDPSCSGTCANVQNAVSLVVVEGFPGGFVVDSCRKRKFFEKNSQRVQASKWRLRAARRDIQPAVTLLLGSSLQPHREFLAINQSQRESNERGDSGAGCARKQTNKR